MKNFGIVLLVIGLLMTVFTSINLVTKKEVVDIGRLEIVKKESKPIYWSPILGIILMGVGVTVVVFERKKG
jgi:hypothetical protein